MTMLGGSFGLMGGASAPAVYATWNPADKDAAVSLLGGDLTAGKTGGAGWVSARATVSKTASGLIYWENLVVAKSSYIIFGIGNASAALNDFVGDDVNGWGTFSNDGSKYHSGTNAPFAVGVSYGVNDVIAFYWDVAAGTIGMKYNNTDKGVMYSGLSGALFPMVSLQNAGNTVTTNFGATAFTYTPPVGYGGLSS